MRGLRVEVIHVRDITPGWPAEYVGRPAPRARLRGSVLANPFPVRVEAERADVLARYGEWLVEQVAAGAWPVLNELNRLARELAGRRVLRLACWCVPRHCHAETVGAVAAALVNSTLPFRQLDITMPVPRAPAAGLRDPRQYGRPRTAPVMFHAAMPDDTTACNPGTNRLIHATLIAAEHASPDRRCHHPGCARRWPPYRPELTELDTAETATALVDYLFLVDEVVERRYPEARVGRVVRDVPDLLRKRLEGEK